MTPLLALQGMTGSRSHALRAVVGESDGADEVGLGVGIEEGETEGDELGTAVVGFMEGETDGQRPHCAPPCRKFCTLVGATQISLAPWLTQIHKFMLPGPHLS